MVRDAIEKHPPFQPAKRSKSRIKRLRGLRRPQYRLRVDEVRVLYDIVDERVEILAIVSKRDAADWLDVMGEKE